MEGRGVWRDVGYGGTRCMEGRGVWRDAGYGGSYLLCLLAPNSLDPNRKSSITGGP